MPYSKRSQLPSGCAGGKAFLSTEVTGIRQMASGYEVDCADGRIFTAKKLVVAAPMPWAVFSLLRGDRRFDALRATIRRRKAFPACFMRFVALDSAFDLGGANVLVDWADSGRTSSLRQARKVGRELNAATAPLSCVVAGAGRANDESISMTVAATLSWDYAGNWGTAGPSASGYYASKALLADEGCDLDEQLCSLEA